MRGDPRRGRTAAGARAIRDPPRHRHPRPVLRQYGRVSAELLVPLESVRTELGHVRLPLPGPGADEARTSTAHLVNQLDDYILPRLRDLDAPLLAVVGGSTGSGKSTLVNGLVGAPVTTPGVLRPTTRHPVLAHNPADTDWFASERILPRLPLITGATARAGLEDVYGLRLVAVETVPEGLGLLDAPDLDSVSHTNRDMADLLLAAADLWLFVTTAARYADAVPWGALRAAVDRNAAVVIVLNRVPPEAVDEVSAHVRELLVAERLGGAPLFVIPESPLVDGMLPVAQIAPVRDWLHALVADAATRAAVARRTLDGAVGELIGRLPGIAAACEAQSATEARLRRAADVPYAGAVERVTDSSADGSLMRGEVLSRWQEFVGTGELLKKMESGVGRMRDRISAAWRGEAAPPERVSDAIESGVAALIIAEAHDAARQADGAWRADPAGVALLGGDDLARASVDIAPRAAAAVRGWQDDVLELIRAEGADKRQTARFMAYGVNATAVALMVAVFSTTGGLTGAEIGIAGASSVLAQKALEAVFGEDAVRRMSKVAKERLDERVAEVMAAERARFDLRLDALDLDPSLPGRLRASSAAAAAARDEADSRAELPEVVLPAAAPPAKKRWRDSWREWWNG